MNIRRNRGTLAGEKIPAKELADHPGYARFKSWHWGIAPAIAFEWKDSDYPEHLIECGRLIELRVLRPGDRRVTKIVLRGKESNESHLCFDPDHGGERLYLCTAPAVMQDAAVHYWHNNDLQPHSLRALAKLVGGRHATTDYPNVQAKPVGILTDVIYGTNKKGDGSSYYIHKLGEESHICPALAVDVRGRFWIVGGNYTAPDPGITD